MSFSHLQSISLPYNAGVTEFDDHGRTDDGTYHWRRLCSQEH